MNIKVLNRLSEKSFDMLLKILNEVFPDGVKLSVFYYEAKKRLHVLRMGYGSIHVCKFDCALFWTDYASFDKFSHYGESRYKLTDRKGKKNSTQGAKIFFTKRKVAKITSFKTYRRIYEVAQR